MSKISKTKIAMRKLGSFGGKATVRKYGKKHMKSLANKRWHPKTPKSKASPQSVDV